MTRGSQACGDLGQNVLGGGNQGQRKEQEYTLTKTQLDVFLLDRRKARVAGV